MKKSAKPKEKILCSACFAINCRFDGLNNIYEIKNRPTLKKLLAENEIYYFCPEVSGGLPTPREGARISGSTEEADGKDVLKGKARFLFDDGEDITAQILSGAKKALQLCKQKGIKKAILKRSSPSCGFSITQGGIQKRKKIKGNGVMAAALIREGIKVMTEKDFPEQK